jgi:hypothetical protein
MLLVADYSTGSSYALANLERALGLEVLGACPRRRPAARCVVGGDKRRVPTARTL